MWQILTGTVTKLREAFTDDKSKKIKRRKLKKKKKPIDFIVN